MSEAAAERQPRRGTLEIYEIKCPLRGDRYAGATNHLIGEKKPPCLRFWAAGLEPAWCYPTDFKSVASADSATPRWCEFTTGLSCRQSSAITIVNAATNSRAMLIVFTLARADEWDAVAGAAAIQPTVECGSIEDGKIRRRSSCGSRWVHSPLSPLSNIHGGLGRTVTSASVPVADRR